MAGVKGKSGLRQGMTNNPNGRPIGRKNKNPNFVKKALEELFNDNVEQLKKDLKNIDRPEIRAKLLIDIGKVLTPRPLNESEEDENKTRSEIMKRLFNSEV